MDFDSCFKKGENNMSKLGYRTEKIYGEGYRDIVEVIAHEVFELRNADILIMLSEKVLNGTEEGKKCATLIEELNTDAPVPADADDELFTLIEKGYEDATVTHDFVRSLVDKINEVTGKKLKYVLWLCDTADDVKLYNEKSPMDDEVDDEDIDCYFTSDVILSDLGDGTKLYAYEEMPTALDADEFLDEDTPVVEDEELEDEEDDGESEE
jgi:hypothetical protein